MRVGNNGEPPRSGGRLHIGDFVVDDGEALLPGVKLIISQVPIDFWSSAQGSAHLGHSIRNPSVFV